jgi:hypothetical protein
VKGQSGNSQSVFVTDRRREIECWPRLSEVAVCSRDMRQSVNPFFGFDSSDLLTNGKVGTAAYLSVSDRAVTIGEPDDHSRFFASGRVERI